MTNKYKTLLPNPFDPPSHAELALKELGKGIKKVLNEVLTGTKKKSKKKPSLSRKKK